jgi:spermidine synthase
LSKSLFISAAGQIPDLLPSVMVSFFAVAPLCLVFGIQFVAALEKGDKKSDRYNFLNTAYFYEALGFVLGGLVFSYGLVFLNEFQTSTILIFLNLIAVLSLLFFEKEAEKKIFFIAAMAMACVGFGCFLCSEQLNIRSAALRFPNEQLMETKNSVYGNLAVTRTGHQLNFYESGLAVGTDKDEAFNEYLVSFPMLSHRNPQKVLLIGTGFSGALSEILKYNPQQIFYMELDPAIIDLARSYIPELRSVMDKGQVIVIKEDPRTALKELPGDLDVVIINLPNPSTALINRYFTDDFFKEVRGHLKPDGVMATHLKFAADSISGPLGDLGACLYKTIQRNFTSVVILPEDVLFIMASQKPLTQDPQELSRRLKARGIHHYFVNSPAIVYRYTTDRVWKTEQAFKTNKAAWVNFDLHPQGYLYNLIYWLSIFHQGLAGVFACVMRINYLFVLCMPVLLISLLLLGKSPAFDRSFLVAAMGMGGFSLMAAEVIVIYGFQVFYGNLYYKIAWIISAFMAATAVGALWGNRDGMSSQKHSGMTKLVKIHAAIGIYFIFWFLLMRVAVQFQWVPLPWLWTIFGAGIGILTGMEFSCINILYFSDLKQEGKTRIGAVYAADLLGACLGALGISVFMIPAYGVYKTLLFLVMINITLAIVLFNSKSPGFFLRRNKPR